MIPNRFNVVEALRATGLYEARTHRKPLSQPEADLLVAVFIAVTVRADARNLRAYTDAEAQRFANAQRGLLMEAATQTQTTRPLLGPEPRQLVEEINTILAV
jgi:hypothetical protein